MQMISCITDFNGLHDVMLEIDGKNRNTEELLNIFKSLPYDIQSIAHRWTCSDTEFVDSSYTFLKKRYKNG